MTREATDFIETIDELKFKFSDFAKMYNVWNNSLSEEEKDDICKRIIPSTRKVDIFLKTLDDMGVDFKTFRKLFNIWISISENERIEIYRSAKIMRIY